MTTLISELYMIAPIRAYHTMWTTKLFKGLQEPPVQLRRPTPPLLPLRLCVCLRLGPSLPFFLFPFATCGVSSCGTRGGSWWRRLRLFRWWVALRRSFLVFIERLESSAVPRHLHNWYPSRGLMFLKLYHKPETRIRKRFWCRRTERKTDLLERKQLF